MAIKTYNDFTWWLNLIRGTEIPDSDFVAVQNMKYNDAKQIQTKLWYKKFWNQIGSNPITSYFFYQRDDNLNRYAICTSGTQMYSYDEWTDTWVSIATGLMQFETLPWRTDQYTKRDFAVYKNVVYMCDWVNPYCSWDGTTFNKIWISAAITGTTADNTTDTFTKTSHWLIDWDEIYISGWTVPTGVTTGQVYYVISATTNTFKISTATNWTAVNFTTNGSGFSLYKLTQPRCRYISYLADCLVWAWDDANPITLYYTDVTPTDWTDISNNFIVIGWDETGIINWLAEYQQLILVNKSNKRYVANIWATPPSAVPMDSQNWWYSDRVTASVENWLVYFNERWFDILSARDWVSGASAIRSWQIWEKVREITKLVKPKSYNNNCGQYIKENSNYYVTLDTNNDWSPDTTLVYSSQTKSWTQYLFPEIFDYWIYIDSEWVKHYIITSSQGGQCYEYEVGYTDNGTAIESMLQTKPFDFGDPAQVKTSEFIDITWRKQSGDDIYVEVLGDDQLVLAYEITDDQLVTKWESQTLWIYPLGTQPLGSWEDDQQEWLQLYPYTVRLPMYQRYTTIAVRMSATWVQWILERMRIQVEWEPKELFSYNNIL